MRRQDFIESKMEGIKFRVSFPEEVITIQELIDEFAIGFAEWLYRYDNTRLPNGNWIIKLGLKPYTSKELLAIYKKEKDL